MWQVCVFVILLNFIADIFWCSNYTGAIMVNACTPIRWRFHSIVGKSVWCDGQHSWWLCTGSCWFFTPYNRRYMVEQKWYRATCSALLKGLVWNKVCIYCFVKCIFLQHSQYYDDFQPWLQGFWSSFWVIQYCMAATWHWKHISDSWRRRFGSPKGELILDFLAFYKRLKKISHANEYH